MGGMKNVSIEIHNSPALSYLLHEIQQLKKFVQIKTCGQCKKKVLESEYTIIYPDKEGDNGVCNECWMKHYMPFTKEYNVHNHKQDGPSKF